MTNRCRPLSQDPRDHSSLRDILDEMQAGESIDRWAMEHDSHDLAQSPPDRPVPLYARKPPR